MLRQTTDGARWLLSASLPTKWFHQAEQHFTRVNTLEEKAFRIGNFQFVSADMSHANKKNDYPPVKCLPLLHGQTRRCDAAASPVLCANRALFFVLGAEVWGALQIDQLVLPHRPDVNVFGDQLLACPHGPVNHLGGGQVLGLQVNGNLPQVLQAFPAGPYGTGAGHTMAFTFHHQCLFQYLDMRTWTLRQRSL